MLDFCFCGKTKRGKRISETSTKLSQEDELNNQQQQVQNKTEMKKSIFYRQKKCRIQKIPLNVQERQNVPNKFEETIQQYYKSIITKTDGNIEFKNNSDGQQEVKQPQMYRIQKVEKVLDQYGNYSMNIVYEKITNNRVARLIAENACVGNQENYNYINGNQKNKIIIES